MYTGCRFCCFWAHLCLCTVGSYASLSVCLSVCLLVTPPIFRLENNSYLRKYVHISSVMSFQEAKKCQFSLDSYMAASITYCMVHLQAFASYSPDTPAMSFGSGRWAHFNVKLHFFIMSVKTNHNGVFLNSKGQFNISEITISNEIHIYVFHQIDLAFSYWSRLGF